MKDVSFPRVAQMACAIGSLFVIGVWTASGTIIPAERIANWPNTGVPGGIPTRTTIYTTLGPTATTSDINTALANCPSNQVVFLSAGTYNLSGTITIGKSGVTLRGAGPGLTILNNVGVSINDVNNTYPHDPPPFLVNWTAGYAQGTTNLTLSSTSGLQVGNILVVDQLNSGYVMQSGEGCNSCSRSSGSRFLQQYTLVTAINGNTVTISPGIYATNFDASLSPQAWWWSKSQTVQFSGVEDLRINTAPSGNNIYFGCTYACWAKNIYSYLATSRHIQIWGTKNTEVRHCTLDNETVFSSNNYGFEARWSSDVLLEDNIIYTIPNGIKIESLSGSVFAYNFGTNFVYNPSTWLSECSMLHGGYPYMNLMEGNYIPSFIADNIHGSSSHNVVFRNRYTGWEPGKSGGTYSIRIFTNAYSLSIVGNVLGTAGYHTAYTGGGGAIYEIDTTDPYALNSIIRHGNYDTVNNAIIWSANTDHNIPLSYLHPAGKPTWFGDRPWPPYDPASPTTAGATNIPAGYRFFLGVDPPTGPPNLPPIAVISASSTNAPAGTNIVFDASRSSDPEGVSLTYFWDFGDGANSTAVKPSHAYATNGLFKVQLNVSDGVNTTSTNISIRVTLFGVNLPPTAVASASPSAGPAPLAVSFSSSGSADPEGSSLTYSWNFGDGTTSTAANPAKTYSNPGVYTARLTVSDGTNTSAPSTVAIIVGNPGNGLVAAYGFEDGGGSTLSDTSGNGNNGTVNGASWANGKYGGALSFNGSSMVTVGDAASLDLSSGMTLEAWVYPTSLSTTWSDIIYKATDTYFLMGSTPQGQAPDLGGTFAGTNVYGNPLPLNTWSHIAGTYDGTTMRFYVNGVLVSSQPQSGSIPASTGPLSIGGDSISGQYWTGLIDEVRVYNRALSSSEVITDMTTPVAGVSTSTNRPPVAVASANTTSGGVPLTVAFSSSGSYDPDGAALTYTWTFGDGATSTAANPSHTYNASGSYNASLAVSDGTYTSVSTNITITVGNAANGLVAAYGFEEGSGSSVTDASGNHNNGTISGAVWSNNGRFGKALSFNGTSALVTIPDSPSLDMAAAITLEAWVNPSALGTSWSDIIFKATDTYFLMGCTPQGQAPDFGGAFSPTNVYGAKLPLNTWSHIAGTYDGTMMRFYVNGLLVASRPQSGAIQTSSGVLSIGGDSSSGQFWNGLIDEVRVYNRALSQAEIHSDMNVPLIGTNPKPPVVQNPHPLAGP
jgi:PKD repeat protein